MPEVTIGVPVYNGADLLAESLECLVNQTFRDIEILIYDNASTDDTQQIAESYAARDPRIRYVRRSENAGPWRNFLDPLERAASPYFMWRAHDDLSSLDYIEKLVAAMKASPDARLATGTIEHVHRNARKTRLFVPQMPRPSIAAIEIVQLLFRSHAGWFYGLWDTATLRPILPRIHAEFPHGWASDHLMLYPVLLDRAVVAVPEVRFIQRVVVKEYTAKKGQKPPLAFMLELRQLFWDCCMRFLAERSFSWATRAVIKVATWRYLGKRAYRVSTVLRRSLAERFYGIEKLGERTHTERS
jgi:glycosyltransferase involved in cell wall biosynthesis